MVYALRTMFVVRIITWFIDDYSFNNHLNLSIYFRYIDYLEVGKEYRMSRLTINENGTGYCNAPYCQEDCNTCIFFRAVLDKLAHYEDLEEAGRTERGWL